MQYIWNSKHGLYHIIETSEHFLDEFTKQGMI